MKLLLITLTAFVLSLAVVGTAHAWDLKDCEEVNFDHPDCEQFQTPSPTPSVEPSPSPDTKTDGDGPTGPVPSFPATGHGR